MDTGELDQRHIITYFDQLQWPFTGLIVGASQCGKSSFLLKLIEQRNSINKNPIKVLYIYDQYQPIFEQFKERNPDVIYPSDLYDVDKYVDGSQKFLVAFDGKANYFLRHFYTIRSHHSNCSVLTIIHNAFPKNFRLISLNSTYLILFKNLNLCFKMF
jgi:GTPase SAR1 family protein